MVSDGGAFENWCLHANVVLKDRYLIDLEDAGLEEHELIGHAAHFSDPADFVAWFGTKYDLTPVEDWSGYCS